MTGRFAPTPSGRMHLGNIFSALLCWLSVRSQGGELLLRIEDLDTLRCTVENADILKDDLRWLGLTWDRECAPQRHRSARYEEILHTLLAEGHVFPCWCTRGDLKNAPNAPHASDGHPIYPGTCRRLTAEERQILLLSVLQGYTMREIAQILDLPQGTVSSKLHRTLKKLRAMLAS